jgi:nucleotide-binding universal stress UspA family protein
MYKKILVPLDGSKLAECALPYAEELAKGCGTEEVILVSVTERVQGYRVFDDPSQLQGQRLILEAVGKKQEQAQRYLVRIAKKLTAKGIKVRTEVLFWPPAEAIASYAEQNGADIIVMSSHGRSGPSRWTHGSVADKVFRASSVPVLMVRAPGCLPGI